MANQGRVAVFVGPNQRFEIRTYPIPEPGPGEILVRVHQANVCGSDVHVWKGEMERMGRLPPTVLGHEATGTVAALGAQAETDSRGTPLREGDRIVWAYYVPCRRCPVCLRGKEHACAMSLISVHRPCEFPPHFVGGFGEYYVIRAGQARFRAPAELSDVELAGANCALAQVLFGLERVDLRWGESLVIQGAGGLGLYAVAVAKEMGANPIVVIDGSEARLRLAQALGADATIALPEFPDPRARTAEVQKLTGNWGADVVVEVAGTPDPYPEGIRMLARGGRYLALGSVVPGRTFAADPSLLIGPNRSVIGVSLYPARTLFQAVEFLRRNQHRYPLHSIAAETFSLDQMDEAFTAAATGSAGQGGYRRIAVRPFL
ncbi:MAG: zinc-binding alcohol dehydrogenase [Candidatus Binatia bacterium]|nr:MAG: zinc-binding alcohol dehydrogenase [Candidatus Binatia bacterium]